MALLPDHDQVSLWSPAVESSFQSDFPHFVDFTHVFSWKQKNTAVSCLYPIVEKYFHQDHHPQSIHLPLNMFISFLAFNSGTIHHTNISIQRVQGVFEGVEFQVL